MFEGQTYGAILRAASALNGVDVLFWDGFTSIASLGSSSDCLIFLITEAAAAVA